MRRTFAALAFGLSLPLVTLAVEPQRTDEQAFISRAVFVDGRVWLLTDAGELSSIAEGSDKRVEEAVPEPVRDICVHKGKLVALTCQREGCTSWALRRRGHDAWSTDVTVPVRREQALALNCENSGVSLLTTRRLVDIEQGKLKEIQLSEPLDRKPVAAVHDSPAGIFVGFNAGEWGGGLRRIDRQTGRVFTIESNESGELCGGPLNTDCDPVNGIVTEPWNRNCVAVAIGLVHMTAHGRIVEVCATAVRRLYFKPLEWRSTKPGDFLATVAFFGLSSTQDSLWASGIDGIYEIDSGVTAKISPMPEFKEIGGVYVNFDSPRRVLVLTQINQRLSVSGAVPLLVPRP